MDPLLQTINDYGGDPLTVLAFDKDRPELLPYETLLSARRAGRKEFASLFGIYEWQDRPLLLLVEGESLGDYTTDIGILRRAAAMRGDTPYLGVVRPGLLSVYHIDLDNRGADAVRVSTDHALKRAVIPFLANCRPGAARRNWISDVVLRLLSDGIDALVALDISGEDAISLVGRALFTRFLADRMLLGPETLPSGYSDPILLFDSLEAIAATVQWLNDTFNGDFLPLSETALTNLTPEGIRQLGNILMRAPSGQLSLPWEEKWDRLDFAQIPVGVLSQAYDRYQRRHHAQTQRREGAYYTPRHIADLMVRAAFRELSRAGNAHAVRVLDPAVGAGVFIVSAFRQLVGERWRRDGYRPDTETLRSILYGQLTGLDIKESALRFAALGLYLISIELDPHPEPLQKLRFDHLRPTVLRKLATSPIPEQMDDADSDNGPELGSLGEEVGDDYLGAYDLVIGNPPWTGSTGLKGWNWVQNKVSRIARERLQTEEAIAPLPNEVMDLPFVWRALEWAKPGGQIAFALHARLLFQQGETMPKARAALFAALDVTGIINGTELRNTKVWPEIAAPFCLLFARNQRPGPGSGFRFVTPRLEDPLNSSGAWRIDASNAETVLSADVVEQPVLLKLLFRGSRLDAEIWDRLATRCWPTLDQYWREFGVYRGRPRFAGSGYQKLRGSSRLRRHGDGLPGVSAEYLHKYRKLSSTTERLVIGVSTLPQFDESRIHDPRPVEIFTAPLLIVKQSPPVAFGRIRTWVATEDVAYNESYYGYSASQHPEGELLTKYLALVIGSRLSIWFALVSSGKFGFEREVVEKIIIDNIPIRPFDSLRAEDKSRIAVLVAGVSDRGDEDTWNSVDHWVYALYGLTKRDIQVVNDTLRYNAPFAESRRAAQLPPTTAECDHFCAALSAEMAAWGARLRRDLSVVSVPVSSLSPWRFVALTGDRSDLRSVPELYQNGFVQVADAIAATEITIADPSVDRLWLGRLNQARYWSPSQARLVARRVIWEHVDFLAGSPSQ